MVSSPLRRLNWMVLIGQTHNFRGVPGLHTRVLKRKNDYGVSKASSIETRMRMMLKKEHRCTLGVPQKKRNQARAKCILTLFILRTIVSESPVQR